MSIRRNTAYNLAGAVVPVALSLVTLPLYLGAIGEARYGVLSILWVLLGYFGAFDLGMGRATAQRIAALASATPRERSAALTSALAVSAGFGALGTLLLLAAAGLVLGRFIDPGPELRAEALGALPWLALALPVATIAPALQGALQGRERFLALNLINLSGTVLFQVLPLLAALTWGPDLRHVLPAAVLARAATLLLLLVECRRHVLGPRPAAPSRAEARGLVRFGGWTTVAVMTGQLMQVLDRALIGAIAGPSAVTHFAVPFQLAERTTIPATSLGASIFPRYHGASEAERDRLTRRALAAIGAVTTPLTIVAVLLVGPFLAWWLTPGFARDAEAAARLLLAAFWVNGFAIVSSTRLQALGRAEAVARCHLLEVVPYLLLLWALVQAAGPAGAAAAFLARALTELLLLAAAAGVLGTTLATLALPGALVAIAFALSAPGLLGEGPRLALGLLLLAAALLHADGRRRHAIAASA